MTTLAHRKIITPKRALAVMTGHATWAAAGRMMIQRFGRRHLSPLRHPDSDLVTFIASYFLMLGMIESHAECCGDCRSPGIPTQLMARTTGRDIAAARLRAQSVTSITRCVRIEAGRDRETNPST